MGYGRATTLTAIGDAVNTASRLESLNKEYGSQLIVSEETIDRAGFDLTDFPRHEVELRGERKCLPSELSTAPRIYGFRRHQERGEGVDDIPTVSCSGSLISTVPARADI